MIMIRRVAFVWDSCDAQGDQLRCESKHLLPATVLHAVPSTQATLLHAAHLAAMRLHHTHRSARQYQRLIIRTLNT